MNVDKNLFLYDLAVVAIMKNEAPYVKEWLDYHLLAGVDHFFIYDNDSPDNQREVIQPYVDAGLVTYIFYPGKARQIEAYNAAVRDYKFFCRYMAFIDGDEFILPKSKPTIVEVVDDVVLSNENCVSLCIPWMLYGFNGQIKADYSVGVLKRFTRRNAKDSDSIKSVLNPRTVECMWTPHYAVCFDSYIQFTQTFVNKSANLNFRIADKIVVNHYYTKSSEEWQDKINRGIATGLEKSTMVEFEDFNKDCNEVFDDSIIRYRDERLATFKLKGNNLVEKFAEIKQLDFDRLLNALASTLLPSFDGNVEKLLNSRKYRLEYFKTVAEFQDVTSKEIFDNKAETFFTCLALSTFLKETFLDEEAGQMFERFSLKALCKSFRAKYTWADFQLLIKEMPDILALPYSETSTARKICIEITKHLKKLLQDSIKDTSQLEAWKDICGWDDRLRILEAFDNYVHK